MELRQISDRMQLLVNIANGNVVVRYNDLRVGGEGYGTDVSHVYNNLSTGSGAFGRGWSMSTGKDVGLEIQSSKIILHGPTGYTSTFTGSNGSYTSGSGMNAKLTRNSDGTYQVKFDKTEESWVFHSNGVLKEMRAKHTNVNLKFNYDAANADRLTAIYDPLGRVTTMSEYDSANRIVRMTDQVGDEYGPFAYDDTGNLVSFPDQLGNSVRFGYDAAGNLTDITAPSGDRYKLGYDGSRRVTSVAEPTGGDPDVTTFSYPASGQTKETDPRGNTSTYYFDSQGRQTKATDPLGHSQSKTWTANSDVASTTNSLGNSITYGFDGKNNPTSATQPTGARSVAGYTDASHPYFPTSTTDAQNNQLTATYNASGDLVSVKSVQQARDVFKFEYNNAGQVTKSTDGEGRVTTFGYDGGGRQTVTRPPAPLGTTVFSYDDKDRVIEIADGNGVRITYGYDAMDRLVQIGRRNSDGTVVPVQYNNFDADGNLSSRYFENTGVQFDYSPRNQVTGARNTRGLTTYAIYYSYDPAGNLATIFDPGGRVDYTYDKANRLTFQSGPKSNMYASFNYDDGDNRTLTTFPNGFKVLANYDKSDRPTSLVAMTSSAQVALTRTYEWTDANGKDTSLLQQQVNDRTQGLRYRYDNLNQLVSTSQFNYTLDKASNLTAAEGRSFSINGAGQVASSGGVTYTHDAAGNLTQGSNGELANQYSPTNQLTSSTTAGNGTIATTYDTHDQSQRAVIRKTNGASVTEQTLENTAIGVTGVSTNGARSAFVRDSAGGLIGQVSGTGESLYAVTDYQGSTLALVDGSQAVAAKYTYTPYGTTTSTGRAAAQNPFRWIGGFQLGDAHGSYALGYRQHDPTLARFTQPDPSNQEPNPYTYGLANPIAYTDPTGLAPLACNIAGVFAAAGGGAVGGVLGLGVGTLVGGPGGTVFGAGAGAIIGGGGLGTFTTSVCSNIADKKPPFQDVGYDMIFSPFN